MFSVEPTVVPMLGDRRRHHVSSKSKSASNDEDSAAGAIGGVQRLVYLAALDELVTCERDRGASRWEASGRMRLRR